MQEEGGGRHSAADPLNIGVRILRPDGGGDPDLPRAENLDLAFQARTRSYRQQAAAPSPRHCGGLGDVFRQRDPSGP